MNAASSRWQTSLSTVLLLTITALLQQPIFTFTFTSAFVTPAPRTVNLANKPLDRIDLFSTTTRSSSSSASASPSHRIAASSSSSSSLKAKSKDDEDDWRNFRAKLVMQYRDSAQTNTDTSTIADNGKSTGTNTGTNTGTAWAYESGQAIEKGSIILSRPVDEDADSDDISSSSGGLAQQYFHKSIILVLEHEEEVFTKGILLNRPTNLILKDDDFVNADGTPLEECNEESAWKAWFGGEVNGILSDEPHFMCLHSLDIDNRGGDDGIGDEYSEVIMKGIKLTTLDTARKMVHRGQAKATDFLTFIGYCGWDAGQLRRELDEGSWYMVAADSNTVLEELKKNDGVVRVGSVDVDRDNGVDMDLGDGTGTGTSTGVDIVNAGVETWELLMNMIGKGHEISNKNEESFEDLMLREWTKERLVYPAEDEEGEGLEGDMAMDTFLKKATASKSFGSESLGVGSVLRSAYASTGNDSYNYNPFLLSDQEYHKSILLILQDDDEMSIGVILNLPSSSVIQIGFVNDQTGETNAFKVPERYGGRFDDASGEDEDEEVVLWFHNHDELKDMSIGKPLGMDVDDASSSSSSGIWSISADDAANAIATGKARAGDFIAVSGLSVWEKTPGGIAGGIRGEVNNGLFELVEPEHVDSVWDTLLEQEVMSMDTLDENISLMDLAWSEGSSVDDDDVDDVDATGTAISNNGASGDLADTALRKWIIACMLDSDEETKKQ